jgi:hypothetical protein|tara:strand:+ start:265 stop:525 length:261 start_codon:yes stop_codon:yes gene_type:complete
MGLLDKERLLVSFNDGYQISAYFSGVRRRLFPIKDRGILLRYAFIDLSDTISRIITYPISEVILYKQYIKRQVSTNRRTQGAPETT